jgi:hypothetical protein
VNYYTKLGLKIGLFIGFIVCIYSVFVFTTKCDYNDGMVGYHEIGFSCYFDNLTYSLLLPDILLFGVDKVSYVFLPFGYHFGSILLIIYYSLMGLAIGFLYGKFKKNKNIHPN